MTATKNQRELISSSLISFSGSSSYSSPTTMQLLALPILLYYWVMCLFARMRKPRISSYSSLSSADHLLAALAPPAGAAACCTRRLLCCLYHCYIFWRSRDEKSEGAQPGAAKSALSGGRFKPPIISSTPCASSSSPWHSSLNSFFTLL
mmetsp:Transcript_28124/g.71322  ORF Transcript_28124/g.71322 Transcript_28124/m.71322 type:complete len:149 (-) Transcript_28124:58-504(-)